MSLRLFICREGMHLDFSHYKEVKERRVSNAFDLPAQLGTRPTIQFI